uniref:CARMIL pleckstrin homology domain-containing protein n=1 Tax=Knipowitschia caucasica TaxID=637954 RepID=A0AAV2K7K2_KNICA
MEEASLSTELTDSVLEAVGRGLKIELKIKVQLELKDKVETWVLVLAPHRLFLLSARVPSKVEQWFSLLDLQELSSTTPTQLSLDFDRSRWGLRSVGDVDDVIAHIGFALRRICPAAAPAKLFKKLILKPVERMAPLLERWGIAQELGPCGQKT